MPQSLTQFIDDLPMVRIVDVGAAIEADHVHYQAIIAAGKAEVIGFDGDQNAVMGAQSHMRGQATIYPHLIGDGGPATFHHNAFPLTNSLFPANTEIVTLFTQLPELLKPVSETAVQTVRLDDLDEITSADALFIDVQGGELDVITHAKRIMDSLLVVHTEVEFVELYKGQPLFADLDPVIRSHGMMFHCFRGLAGRPFDPIVVAGDPNKNLNGHLWSDAIYMADPRRYPELESDQLLKLAFIMNDVYGSVDVAFIALRAFDQRHDSRYAPDYMDFLAAAG